MNPFDQLNEQLEKTAAEVIENFSRQFLMNTQSVRFKVKRAHFRVPSDRLAGQTAWQHFQQNPDVAEATLVNFLESPQPVTVTEKAHVPADWKSHVYDALRKWLALRPWCPKGIIAWLEDGINWQQFDLKTVTSRIFLPPPGVRFDFKNYLDYNPTSVKR